MKDQITKGAVILHICKSDETSEDNGTRHLDNPDGRRDVCHLAAPGSGGTPRKVWQGIARMAFSMCSGTSFDERFNGADNGAVKSDALLSQGIEQCRQCRGIWHECKGVEGMVAQ